jgi:prepilin-type processing-associated H-X9-DG protein
MPVPFACPHCGEQTLVDEQFAGQSGPCIACGKLIVVPHFGGAATGEKLRRADSAARRRSTYLLAGLGLAAAVVGVVTIALLVVGPLMESAQIGTNRRKCAANLRQIGTALLQYERDYGTLPPAIVSDAQGTPLYSWRVLILPYLGPQEQRLYSQFRLDQPWNSPANSLLLKQMPKIFRSPGDTAAAADETSYVVIAGPSTPFPLGQPLARSQIGDGVYSTILVVEVAHSGIAWTEPKDLRDNQLSFQIGVDLGGSHTGGMNALFADGHVRFLKDSLSSEEVADLTTANGREATPGMQYGY